MFTQKLSLGAGFGFAAVVLAAILAGFNFVSAAWQEQISTPPNDNVPAPLHRDTQFGDSGNVKGKFDTLSFNVEGCVNDQVLLWRIDAGSSSGWVCSDINLTASDLLSVLQAGSDASAFSGTVKIGALEIGSTSDLDNKTYLNTEGAITGKWLHSTAPGNNTMAGNLLVGGSVGIGTDSPNRKLHIYDINENAEIDIQSTQASGSHWGIYHSSDTDELRFWKEGVDRMVISDKGVVEAENFCLKDGSKCLGSRFVGFTNVAANGNAGGYDGANEKCSSEFAGSHVCSSLEILGLIQNHSSLPNVGDGWILNGPSDSNDCVGWTNNTGLKKGPTWSFDENGGVGYVTPCTTVLPFSCCQ